MEAFKALFSDVPTIDIVYIRSLIELGKEHDVDLLPACHELGINDTTLSSPEGAASINQTLALIEKADQLFTTRDWALQLGLSWSMQIHGMLALPLFQRENPLAIAETALTCMALRLPFVEMLAQLDGDDLVIELRENWPLGKVRRQVLDIYFGIMVRFVSQMDKSFTLCVDSSDREDATFYGRRCDCNVRTHHPGNRLIMHDFSDGNFVPRTPRARQPETPPSSQNQQMILMIRRLVTTDPGRSCTIERVSEKLGTTPRTLSRYLRAAEMSFSELRNGVRAQHAQRYLRETSLPIIDIAERLGYSDQASFSKAFRSWTGQTPGEYRRVQQAEDRDREEVPDEHKKRA